MQEISDSGLLFCEYLYFSYGSVDFHSVAYILTSLKIYVFAGVDSSDDDDDLDHELPWQRLWNDLSSDEGEGDFE